MQSLMSHLHKKSTQKLHFVWYCEVQFHQDRPIYMGVSMIRSHSLGPHCTNTSECCQLNVTAHSRGGCMDGVLSFRSQAKYRRRDTSQNLCLKFITRAAHNLAISRVQGAHCWWAPTLPISLACSLALFLKCQGPMGHAMMVWAVMLQDLTWYFNRQNRRIPLKLLWHVFHHSGVFLCDKEESTKWHPAFYEALLLFEIKPNIVWI